MDYKQDVLREIDRFQQANSADQFEHMSLFIKNVFKQEEEKLVEYDVPDLDIHKSTHQELVRSLESFKDQFLKKKDKAPEDKVVMFSGFVRLWIEDHEDDIDSLSEPFIRISQWTA